MRKSERSKKTIRYLSAYESSGNELCAISNSSDTIDSINTNEQASAADVTLPEPNASTNAAKLPTALNQQITEKSAKIRNSSLISSNVTSKIKDSLRARSLPQNITLKKNSSGMRSNDESIVLQDIGDLKKQCLEIISALSYLREECEQAKKNNTSDPEPDRRELRNECIEKLREKVEIGQEEMIIFQFLTDYLTKLELQAMKYPLMIKLLTAENEWLRSEIDMLSNRYGFLDKNNEIAEQMRLHFQNLYHLRKNEMVTKKDNKRLEVDITDLGGEIPDHLKHIYNIIRDYIKEGLYDVALALAQKSYQEAMAERAGMDEQVLLLNVIALVYREKGDYQSAVKQLKQALKLRENVLGKNSIKLAGLLNNIAVLYGKRENFAKAEPYCRRSMEIRERELGTDNLDVAKQYNNLGLIMQNNRKSDEAEKLFIKAADIYRAKGGGQNYVKTLNNLAAYYMSRQQLAEAEVTVKRTLDLWHTETFGIVHVEMHKLYELIEMKAEDTDNGSISRGGTESFMKQCTKLGRITNSSYKTAIRLLLKLYTATNRIRETNLLTEYIQWCQHSDGVGEMIGSRIKDITETSQMYPDNNESSKKSKSIAQELKNRFKKMKR